MNTYLKKLTIPCLLENSFTKYSNRIALSGIEQNSLKYSELKDKILSVSELLRQQGIIKGDKVALLGENHPHWGIAFFAITSIGAVAVPIMHEFNLVEVHHVVRHSEAKIIFVSSKLLAKLENAEFPELKHKILMDDFSFVPTIKNDIISDTIEKGKREFIKLKETALKFTGNYEVNEDDLASIIYTSGTTGHSKGVMLSHKNLVSNAVSVDETVNVTEDERMLSILPLSHTMECTLGLITPIMKGASVYYLEKPPSAVSLLPALEKVKPSIMLSVPLIIEKIYRTKILSKFQGNKILKTLYGIPVVRKKIHAKAGKKLINTFGGKLRMFCIGGAPLAEDVERFLHEARFPYSVGYGLTESSPLVTGVPPEKFVYRSVGKPIPDVEIKIENEDKITGIGEIFVKGPNVMKGYYRHPEKSKEVLSDEGWLKTGDLGYIDKDGFLFIKGRSKNVIIGPNGKNIYPEELEGLINECEYVLESLVVKKGNSLIAKVHLNYEELDILYTARKIESDIKAEINKILESIRTYVNHRVASFTKITKIYEQEIPFEKTPTRKIKRHLYT